MGLCEIRRSHQRYITTAEMLDGLDAQGHQRQAIISKIQANVRPARRLDPVSTDKLMVHLLAPVSHVNVLHKLRKVLGEACLDGS